MIRRLCSYILTNESCSQRSILIPFVRNKFPPIRDGFVQFIKMFEMIALEPKTQVAGLTAVIIGNEFTWGQLRALKFDDIRTIAKIVQVVKLI